MTADEFFEIIVERSNRKPFCPHIVELVDGSQVEIDRPKSLAITGWLCARKANRWPGFLYCQADSRCSGEFGCAAGGMIARDCKQFRRCNKLDVGTGAIFRIHCGNTRWPAF
jgi:hypothetical protein